MIVVGPQLHPWINERAPIGHSAGNVYVGWVEKQELHAVVAFTDYNGKCMQIHVAAEGKNWMRREFLWATFHYPFVQLKLNWLVGVVREGNVPALRMNLSLGFKEFARLPDGHADGEDIILLRLHRTSPRVQKWLSLGERYGQGITTRSA